MFSDEERDVVETKQKFPKKAAVPLEEPTTLCASKWLEEGGEASNSSGQETISSSTDSNSWRAKQW